MASATVAIAGHEEQPPPNHESEHESAALSSSSSSALGRQSSHPGGDVAQHRHARCRRAARLVKHAWAFLRSSVALLSAILAWLGVWELMDLHAWSRTVPRDVVYVVVSTVVMALVGTLLPNCGIYEDHTAQDAATRAALDNANEIESVMGLSSPSPELPHDPTGAAISSSDAVVGAGASDDHATLIELTPPHCDSLVLDTEETPEPLVTDGLNSNRSGRSYTQACLFMLTRLCTRELIVGVYLRSLISLFASIVFWTGSYNLLLELFLVISGESEVVAYSLNLILGWLLMWTTGTLFDQAGLTETEEEEQHLGLPLGAGEEAPARSCFRLPPRVRVYVRAFFAIAGCMMFWLGASMLLELLSQGFYSDDEKAASSRVPLHCTECEDSTPARNAIFIVLGILFFLLTNTMAVHAGVEESNRSAEHAGAAAVDGQSSQAAPHRRWLSVLMAHPIFRHVRALVSLTGVMMVWEGIWDSAFTATTEASAERMVIYTGVGLMGLMLTDSLFANGGVVPPFSMARRAMHVQERLGYFLQDKEFRHAAQGGFAHDPALDHVVAQRAEAADQERRSSAALTPGYHSISQQPARSAPPTSPSPIPTLPRDSPSLEPFHSLH